MRYERSSSASGRTTYICDADAAVADLRELAGAIETPILVANGTIFEPGRVTLEPEQLRTADYKVVLAFDSEALTSRAEALGLSLNELVYAVFVDNLVLARRQTVTTRPFNSLPPVMELPLSSQISALKSPRGFDLRVIAHVDEGSSAQHSSGLRKGTWFSSSKFEVRPVTTPFRFLPHPLTEDVRRQHKLPRETLSYTHVVGDLFECESLSDAIEVYIDAEILELLSEAPRSDASLSFQVMFATQILAGVLNQIALQSVTHAGFNSTLLADNTSPATRLVSNVAQANKLEPESLLVTLTSNAASANAMAQAYLGARKRVSLALRELV